MAESLVTTKALWTSIGKALGAEFRETASIRGTSGLDHPLRALCVDEKANRVILFSSESNPRVAALIQGDVQATFPDVRVLVARPSVLDLGALVRGFFDNAASATLSLPEFSRYADDFNAMSEQARKVYLEKDNRFAIINSTASAIKNVPIPIWDHVGMFLEQARFFDWPQLLEAMKPPQTGRVSFSQLYNYDSSAIDREYGVCPFPLYEFTDADWELLLNGTRIDDIAERLKFLNIYQYFFPAPDQLALGVVERGITGREQISEIVTSAPSQGHPLGNMELVTSAPQIHELIDALTEKHFVSEVDHTVRVTPEGATSRLKIKASPREGVISKLINRFKFNVRLSTKDIFPR